jgi:hypothetical protein
MAMMTSRFMVHSELERSDPRNATNDPNPKRSERLIIPVMMLAKSGRGGLRLGGLTLPPGTRLGAYQIVAPVGAIEWLNRGISDGNAFLTRLGCAAEYDDIRTHSGFPGLLTRLKLPGSDGR